MGWLTCWRGYTVTSFKCSLSSPSNAPCHFLLGQTCPAGLNWKLSSSPSKSLICFALPFLLAFSLHLLEFPACEWLLKRSICLWIPIYQPVSAYIDWLRIGAYTVQWGQILFMHACRTPGLNHSSESRCRLNSYPVCFIIFQPIELTACNFNGIWVLVGVWACVGDGGGYELLLRRFIAILCLCLWN